MSLATRCPVCQTVFRVVQDQLKVSEGWVRCGRCAKVFNAFQGLFDLEREFPALRQPTPSQRVLEDLATRNRNPQPPSQWQHDLDASSATREIAAPETAPASRAATSAFTTVPAATVRPAATPPTAPPQRAAVAVVPPPAAQHSAAVAAPAAAAPQRAAAAAAPPTAPLAAPSGAAGAGAAVPAPGVAAFRDSAPFGAHTARVPVTRPPDDGATIPPGTVIAPASVAAPQTALAAGERDVFAPSVPAAEPPPAPAQQQVTPPRAARVDSGIAIRDEPAPVPGALAASDAAADEQSFEALFRSDGELAEPPVENDGIDIVLDSDVEPASLSPDDAVDSRLLTFVQEADRAERWRRPWVRAALVLAALALSALLAGQLLVVQRDLIVAQWPGTRSLVQSLCEPLNCRIEPLRRIDQLGVDSSGLTRLDDGPVYRLALVLRNRSDTPLLMPSIDLSLTDAAGVLVSRRMLSASDLGSARTTIAAGQELPLQALLMSAERPLTGYTIEIFYP